jgi:uncharacterized protein (TIGR02246 family)
MKSRLLHYVGLPALACGLLCAAGFATSTPVQNADADAIAKQAEAFLGAFEKGDARAVAAFWTEDGEYTDVAGRHLKGRAEIEKAFADLFAANKGLKARIESESLRFLTPDTALEEGVCDVFPASGAPPSRARFTNIHVKKDGRWLLASVKDSAYTPPSNYGHLRGLDWLIGDWAGETGDGEVEHISLAWSDTGNFVVGNFSTTVKDLSVGSAQKWIGWDPLAKHIRSWSFDDTGAFGEAVWTADGDKWHIKSTTVLQDGVKATATYIVSRGKNDSVDLEAKDRTLDGKPLPDIKPVTLKRVK